MQRRKGFRFITKIDISMGFYTFEIDAQSQKLCVISTPFGLYKYKRLPMGITNSPDFFQSMMHPLFSDLPDVECLIDDIDIFSLDTFSNHLLLLHQVLLRLERNGFTVNPLKCAWATSTTDYLGFLLTPQASNISLGRCPPSHPLLVPLPPSKSAPLLDWWITTKICGRSAHTF